MSEKRSSPAATLSRSRVLIIVVAAVERFAYKGMSIQHGDVPHRRGGDEHVGAAKTVSTRMGVTSMLPLVSSVLVDFYWDRYSTIIAFSLLYVALASHDTQADKGTLLVSHCDHAEDSDPQEVVLQSNTAGSSTEYLASCEIKPVSLEGDSDSIDANEETHPGIQDSPQCRICLDNEGDDLIAPCHCKGTQKYVHRSCLDKWRSTKEGFAFSHCTECRAKFLLRANVPPDRWWLRLKFQLRVVRDHTLFFFIVHMVVFFLGMPVYSFYGDELRQMFGYE